MRAAIAAALAELRVLDNADELAELAELEAYTRKRALEVRRARSRVITSLTTQLEQQWWPTKRADRSATRSPATTRRGRR